MNTALYAGGVNNNERRNENWLRAGTDGFMLKFVTGSIIPHLQGGLVFKCCHQNRGVFLKG